MAVFTYSMVLCVLLLFPQMCAQAAAESLTVWGLSVVPSLFPYMVFSRLLCRQIKNTACPPALVCMLLGSLGGSPSGAAAISAYGVRLSPKAILALSAFTSTISPMFFLGTLTNWTNDPLLCRNLLIAQTLGAALSALCALHMPFSPPSPQGNTPDNPSAAESPLVQSVDVILQVGGSIICFSIVASLFSLLPLPRPLHPVLHALLEISGGAHAIAAFAFPKGFQAVLLAFAVGFGGLCILSQNLLFLKPLGVGTSRLLAFALLRAAFCGAVMAVLLLIQASSACR